MVVQREEEIKRFKPKDYWVIDGKLNGFSMHYQDKITSQTHIFDRIKAEEIVSKVSGKAAKVIDIKREAKKELPPLLYDLTELQRDANRRFGYSAKKTLSIMQRLYENYKLLTYPRTDSRYITDDIVKTLPERLNSIAIGPYKAFASSILRNKIQISKRLVDNSKVTDHHAIIPTEQFVDLSALSLEERNIYDLVVKRFLAILSSPCEFELTSVKLEASNEIFISKGRIVKAKGWRQIYEGYVSSEGEEDEESDLQSLPDMKIGDILKIISVNLINKKTKPPARYTEATLLSAMEHPGKFIDNKALREMIENTSGLGTPATRADIIEKLFDSFYMERNNKEIIPTSKGIQLIELVPADLKMPELTAKWEQQLQQISKGNANADMFVSEMRSYATNLVSNVISSNASYKHDNITREKCPNCGKYLLDVKGKKGKMLVCSDRECGYRKSVSIISNARCPECHKKMEIRGEGDNKAFYCVCGYREKLEAFKKRKGEKVNKKEVNKYLKQQETEGQINSALADALKK